MVSASWWHYIPTHLPTYLPTDLHTYIHTYMHTDLRTCIHTDRLTYMPTYLHSYLPTNLPTYIQTYVPTYMHTLIDDDQETPPFPPGGGESMTRTGTMTMTMTGGFGAAGLQHIYLQTLCPVVAQTVMCQCPNWQLVQEKRGVFPRSHWKTCILPCGHPWIGARSFLRGRRNVLRSKKTYHLYFRWQELNSRALIVESVVRIFILATFFLLFWKWSVIFPLTNVNATFMLHLLVFWSDGFGGRER